MENGHHAHLARLVERAHAAVQQAEKERERSEELIAFVRVLRKGEPADIMRCAWCGSFAAEGYWIDPDRLGSTGVTPRIRAITSHGICPSCFDRLTQATGAR